MFYEENKASSTTNENSNYDNLSECEEKIEKLNKKLQATANELEEISSLYAKSVKDGLDKAKKIKELEDRIAELEKQLKKCQEKSNKVDELENQLKQCQDKRKELEDQLKKCQEKSNKVDELEDQLKECQNKRDELEKQLKEYEDRLKECQDKNKTLDGKQSQWIVGEYKWMKSGSTMPDGWIKVQLDKGLTLVQGNEAGETSGSVGKHTHKFSENYQVWASKNEGIVFIHERTGGPIGQKYVPFVQNFNNMAGFTETSDLGKNITNNNLAAGIFAELWLYVGTKTIYQS